MAIDGAPVASRVDTGGVPDDISVGHWEGPAFASAGDRSILNPAYDMKILKPSLL